MKTKLKATDARVRIANQKIEMIATEIANTFNKVNVEKTDLLIEILYMKTKAIRAINGVDRRAYACVKAFLDSFNLNEFAAQYEAQKMKTVLLMSLSTITALLYIGLKFALAALGATHAILPVAVIGIIITAVCFYLHKTTPNEHA